MKGLIIGLIVFCVFLVVFQSHVVQDIVLFIKQKIKVKRVKDGREKRNK